MARVPRDTAGRLRAIQKGAASKNEDLTPCDTNCAEHVQPLCVINSEILVSPRILTRMSSNLKSYKRAEAHLRVRPDRVRIRL